MQELDKIINKVKEVTGIDIQTKSRKQEIVYAKKIYFHIARQKGYSFQSIADKLNMNHATVIFHCYDTPYLLKQDKKFFNDYLRVQGKPVEGKCSRDYFDLSIANFYKKDLKI